MARPKQPLIDKRQAAVAALRIIDEQGLAKLSMRNLGHALGVNGMSLYHHFDDKDSILDAVAALVMHEVRPSAPPADDYARWSLQSAERARRALLAHPNAIPLFVDRFPGRFRSLMYQQEFVAFTALGIDQRYWLPILETLESFLVGSVLFLRPDVSRTARLSEDFGPDREVFEVAAASDVDYDEVFRYAYLKLVTGLLDDYTARSARSRS